MKKIAIMISVMLAIISVFSFSACSQKVELRKEATVTVFTTNDIHGSVANDEKNGIVGIVKAASLKASVRNALLVDAGDATQGASFASVSRGKDVIEMMNEAGYDLMAAGNHEFDYGADTLLQNANSANFPILAANVKKDGKALLDASVIIEKANYKIGFIGLTTVSTATSTNPTLLQGISFEDEIATAKAEIAAIKDKTDAIVLVCHLGDNSTAVSCTSEALLKGLSADEQAQVDAVIDGHSHTVEDKEFTTSGNKNIPIIQTGVNFTNMGEITLSFTDTEKGAEVVASGRVLDYDACMNYATTDSGKAKEQSVQAAMEKVSSQQKQILDEQLCTLSSPLPGGYMCFDYVESRIVETAYGDFVTDAFAYYANKFADNEKLALPVVAIENGGGISQSLPTWHTNGTTVTRGDVLNAFNHGNLVEVLKVSPAELFSVIEKGLVVTGQDNTGKLIVERVSGSFIQCSGFSYTYDPAGETGNKLVEIKLADGTVIDKNDSENKILLATNNYVSSSFKQAQKLGELGGEDVIVEDYIRYLSGQNNGVLDYKCNYDRINIKGDKSPEMYTVRLLVKDGDNVAANKSYKLFVDGVEYVNDVIGGENTGNIATDADGYIEIKLKKGAHLLVLSDSSQTSDYVYVNNYSGTGVSDQNDGYYSFVFQFGVPSEK